MKRLMTGAVAAISAVGLMVSAAFAADIKPAVVFDMGGKFDKSFNEAAYNGAERFKKESGIEYREFEVQAAAQREQALRRFAERGHNPVVGIGFAQAEAMTKVAKDFPDTKFAIIDMVVDLPNVRSVVFNEHEGSYLVGVMAAKASKTGKVGFIGGMDIPLIRKFACGYVQGVKSVYADAEVLQNLTGTTGEAWNNPVKGGELAKSQMDRGADVVYHAAGGTGLGVLQAAADAGHSAVTEDALVEAGLVKNKRDGLRLLGSGELSAKVDVTVTYATASAREAVEKAGGSVNMTRPETRKRLRGKEREEAKKAAGK